MCGIAGIVGLDTSEPILDKMQATMLHRGPDASGRYRSPGLAFLHTRLAIIDPDHGAQPFFLSWGAERFVMVYNGELYNTEDLRRELLSLGHIFREHSDTEVLIHAYAQWKEKCLDRLNGIFSFAVWEEKGNRLFLARDRMGVKPLFYSNPHNGLIFSSEIKTILAHPAICAELDTEGVAQVLLLGPGRIPSSGVFRNIYALEPGCCAQWQDGNWNILRYWRLKDGENTESFEQIAEKVRCLVSDSIMRQMVSDVPIGTFLSGGLDSSLITAIASERLNLNEEQLHTFSVDYYGNDQYFVPGKFQPESDNAYIQIMARHFSLNHHWCFLSVEELYQALVDAMYARDLPGMADVDSSMLLFCGRVKEYVKVVLSGECADEIFGGYPWFRDPDICKKDGFPWAQNTHIRTNLLHPRYSGRINGGDYIEDTYRQSIAEADILPNVSQPDRRMKEMTYLNQRWFMQTLLDRKDRMSMACGLEVRVPFCDHRIAEYLYTVPWKYKDYQGKEKGLLRYAMAGILPDQVLWRKKSPYPKTYDPQYECMVREGLSRILQDRTAPLHEIVNLSAVNELINKDETWPWYGQLMKRPQTLAYLIMINLWLEKYNINIVD